MKKVTVKFIKEIVSNKKGENISLYKFNDIKKLEKKEGGFEKIYYSTGVYGINGGVVKGNTTGKLYAITSRNTALFMLF